VSARLAVLVVLAAFALALGGCRHARTVAPPTPSTEAAAASPPARQIAERRKTETGVPLATSPEGLLKPGAEAMIQQRLSIEGLLSEEQQSGHLDAVTKRALERFQEAHDLPATGEPDAATVGKLGLNGKEIFREGEAK
jgi:hypothetical protein